MTSDEVKGDRRYSKDHEWAKESGDEVIVGITAFAIDQLGDITLVNLDVKVGDTITQGKAFGTIESVKTLSDLFAPLSGKIARINAVLESAPETMNDDCWEKGWMIAVVASDKAELDSLLDAASYTELLKTSSH